MSGVFYLWGVMTVTIRYIYLNCLAKYKGDVIIVVMSTI